MKRKNEAQWIKNTHFFKRDEYRCSACGYVSDRQKSTCPKCGAKTKGPSYNPSWVDEAETLDMIFND